MTEKLNILKAATRSKRTLLTREIGVLDGTAKAEQLYSKIEMRKFHNLGNNFSNDNSSIISGGNSISRMDTINEEIRYMKININNSGDKLNKVLPVTVSENLPAHKNPQTCQKGNTNLSLKDSIYAQKDQQNNNLSTYHTGIICSAFLIN